VTQEYPDVADPDSAERVADERTDALSIDRPGFAESGDDAQTMPGSVRPIAAQAPHLLSQEFPYREIN